MIAQTDPERSRDFICPCGKDYFSYAALFTHIKQKHNGKVTLITCSHPDRSSNPNLNTNGVGLVSSLQILSPLQAYKRTHRLTQRAHYLASLLLI